MTTLADKYTQLVRAGVPLAGTLAGLHADGSTWCRLHADPACSTSDAFGTTPITATIRIPASAASLTACRACIDDPEGLEEVLGAFSALADALRRTGTDLETAELHLGLRLRGAGRVGVSAEAAEDWLRSARANLDPAMRPHGVTGLQATCLELPTEAADWLADWQTAAQQRLAAALAAYAADVDIERLLTAAARYGTAEPDTDPALDRYVALRDPSRVLTAVDGADADGYAGRARRVVRAVLLTTSPLAWLGHGPLARALYRLPEPQADALLAISRLARDGGQVAAEDTDEVLTAAAAMYDATGEDTPLANPATALAAARDVLTG